MILQTDPLSLYERVWLRQTRFIAEEYDKFIRAYAPTSKSHDTHGIPDILSSYYIVV